MKSFALSFFAAAIAAAAVHAADVTDPKSALVRAMRTDEIALSGAKRAFEQRPAIHRRHQTPAISPVLSAKLFISSPALLSTVSSRFVNGVCSGSSTCWPPLSPPLAPPTRMFGSG